MRKPKDRDGKYIAIGFGFSNEIILLVQNKIYTEKGDKTRIFIQNETYYLIND